MTAHLKILFVIADGVHARWVSRSHEGSEDFHTVRELRAAHPAAGHESNEAVRRAHDSFGREVAEALNAAANHGEFEKLALVAPSQVLTAITAHLNPKAKADLVHSLAKDLIKTPDHELGAWLRTLELG